MEEITRHETRSLMQNEPEATLVEVLSEDQYEKFHLPGAINVPLGDEFDTSIQEAVPNKTKPVVVYCMDEECNASPKAAERMERLGYLKVYDYAAGKMDWKDAGLPTEPG